MTVYDDELMENIKSFGEPFTYERTKKFNSITDPKIMVSEIKEYFKDVTFAVRSLFVIVECEMTQTNKIRNIISKLPDDEKYQELKSLFEERDSDIEETIKPLSKYAKELEESRNRNPNYIG